MNRNGCRPGLLVLLLFPCIAVVTSSQSTGSPPTAADIRGVIESHRTWLTTDADLSGADLSGARCLSDEQFRTAITDSDTTAPSFEVC
jgi:hypothetical protein